MEMVIHILFQMTEHDIGSLVVMKPGEEASIVGIITERGTTNMNSEISYSINYYDLYL